MKRRYCHLCGRRVGHYRLYRRPDQGEGTPNLVVCNKCEATQPRCELCSIPLAGTTAGERFCPVCQATSPAAELCLACRQPVGRRYVYVGDDGPFCEPCWQDRPHCDVCGVPVGEPDWLLPDGRHTCDRCHQTAIYQPERARALYERTVDIIQRDLGLILNVPTEFALVDLDRLQALRQEVGENDNSDPEKTLGIYVRRGRRRGMYVEYGLPQILLIQVMAHEYAHAWLGENCPLLREPLIREGFAEWVAYKVLQALGSTKKMAVMEERQDLYGEGLRHLLEVERARGVAGVFDYCRSAR